IFPPSNGPFLSAEGDSGKDGSRTEKLEWVRKFRRRGRANEAPAAVFFAVERVNAARNDLRISGRRQRVAREIVETGRLALLARHLLHRDARLVGHAERYRFRSGRRRVGPKLMLLGQRRPGPSPVARAKVT